eukprot:NODE_1688_length_769_cov_64.638629_g1639_i0.p1 GENE.NODE_1688_length_769_cov_64.638629_g1639_i0~~NODE_1688_length_769_cov_64.638629_g1639_i0.p1  ORF type:complete len:197 (-),score=23.90 NODE_1688_length_769_cov_64.638629_g1639_i0:99-689(-)
MYKPKILVLDLDGTLVFGTQEPDAFGITQTPDFFHGALQLFKRPGTDEFLEFVLDNFQVVFWSAAPKSYVESVIAQLSWSTPAFFGKTAPLVLHEDSVTYAENKYVVKDLAEVIVPQTNTPLDRILHLDDTPSTYSKNWRNGIPIKSFTGQRHDEELQLLEKFLKQEVVPLENLDQLRCQLQNWRKVILEPETDLT